MRYLHTGILMHVIAVNRSQEFLLNVRRLFYSFFDDDDAAVFMSTRRIFFPRRRMGFNFDDEWMFFRRRHTLYAVKQLSVTCFT